MSERVLLLVDDEPNILRSLVRLLRRDGYQILTATSGREGLEILKEHQVGVIISDQRMPEMTGTEFLSQVKEIYPDTVRIVLSGYTDLNSVTDAINRGAIYKFLTKPWQDDLLRENVQKAFEQYELRAENQRLTEELRQANEILSRQVVAQDRELGLHHHMLELSREILEYLPVGVMGIGDDGVIALANSCMHRLLGVEPGTLLGMEATNSLPPALSEICRAGINGEEICRRTVDIGGGSVVELHYSHLGPSAPAQGSVMVLLPTEREVM